MECPNCTATLTARATYCGCGWKKHKQQYQERAPDVPCAHEACGIAAMCRLKTPTGYANVCWQHYDAHFAERAQESLAAYGLTRRNGESGSAHVTRMRAFVRAGVKRIGRIRQPGAHYQLPDGRDFSFIVENNNPPYVPPVKGQVKRIKRLPTHASDEGRWWDDREPGEA